MYTFLEILCISSYTRNPEPKKVLKCSTPKPGRFFSRNNETMERSTSSAAYERMAQTGHSGSSLNEAALSLGTKGLGFRV